MRTRRYPVLAWLLGVLCALATPAAAQTHDEALATLRASLSPAAYASFTAALRDAQQNGLPTQPLVAKALEGAAKNMPGDRVLLAVRQTADALGRSRGLLQAAAALSTDAEVSAVALAMQRGVPADVLSRLAADSRGRGNVGLSAHVVGDLMQHGVPVAAGLEVIAAWRNHGADPARLQEIPGAVERLVRQGVGPARAGAAISAGLRAGRRPGSIGPADVPRLIRG